jgi:hypothetical protein
MSNWCGAKKRELSKVLRFRQKLDELRHKKRVKFTDYFHTKKQSSMNFDVKKGARPAKGLHLTNDTTK